MMKETMKEMMKEQGERDDERAPYSDIQSAACQLTV